MTSLTTINYKNNSYKILNIRRHNAEKFEIVEGVYFTYIFPLFGHLLGKPADIYNVITTS